MSDIPVADTAPESVELSYLAAAPEVAATRENMHWLQHAADFQTAVRNLRISGIGDIIWGVVICGLMMLLVRGDVTRLLAASWLQVGAFVLGLILIAVGTWNISFPSPTGLLADGIMLLIVGAWNLLLQVAAVAMTGRLNTGVLWPAIIVSQIVWGINRLTRYPRFVQAVKMRPSPTTILWLQDLMKSTLKARLSDDPSLITFRQNESLSRSDWKGRLLPEIAILVQTLKGSFQTLARHDVLIGGRDTIQIVREKKKLVGKRYNVTLNIGLRTVKGVMPEESLRRLRAWLGMPDNRQQQSANS